MLRLFSRYAAFLGGNCEIIPVRMSLFYKKSDSVQNKVLKFLHQTLVQKHIKIRASIKNNNVSLLSLIGP